MTLVSVTEKPSLATRIKGALVRAWEQPGQPGVGGYGAQNIALASPPEWASSDHLAVIRGLYGIADSSNIQVSRGMAMQNDVVAKGRRVLATNLSRMTLKNVKGNTPAPLQMAYLQQPEDDRPLAETLTWTVDALMFYPRTWWIVRKRDSYGWPARGGCKLLSHDDAEFDTDGKLVKAWGEPVTPRDIIQFGAPDGGLLHDGKKTLRRAYVLDRAASLAEANPVPSVNLENTGTRELVDTQIQELLQSWTDARTQFGVGYTDKNIKATPMGISNSQLLLDAQNRMDLKLARQIGIPAWAADVALEGSTLNYQNRSSRAWELIDMFLTTYMTPIVARLSMNDATPIGWSTVFSTDELTRPDIKERFETYEVGKRAGFIDDAWIEAQEGQPLRLGEVTA